jgi:hypothetical protein
MILGFTMLRDVISAVAGFMVSVLRSRSSVILLLRLKTDHALIH